MGLKLLTLATCSLSGKRVKIHKTGERAKVLVEYLEDRTPIFKLKFDDGRIEPVTWSEDMQGFTTKMGDMDEEDPALAGL
jgi:hypothetical protein